MARLIVADSVECLIIAMYHSYVPVSLLCSIDAVRWPVQGNNVRNIELVDPEIGCIYYLVPGNQGTLYLNSSSLPGRQVKMATTI